VWRQRLQRDDNIGLNPTSSTFGKVLTKGGGVAGGERNLQLHCASTSEPVAFKSPAVLTGPQDNAGISGRPESVVQTC